MTLKNEQKMDPSAALHVDQRAPHWASGCRRPGRVQPLLRRRKRYPHALHRRGVGPLVILLHGFPYLWYMWRRQIRPWRRPAFASSSPINGDLGKPIGQMPLKPTTSAVGRRHGWPDGGIGETSAVIVGHDLGAWVAQAAAMMRPDLFRALVMLNTRCRRAERSNRPSPAGNGEGQGVPPPLLPAGRQAGSRAGRRSAQDVAKRLLLHLR